MSVLSSETMAKRPASAVGRRRPICEYAQKAALLSGSFRFKVSSFFLSCRNILSFLFCLVDAEHFV